MWLYSSISGEARHLSTGRDKFPERLNISVKACVTKRLILSFKIKDNTINVQAYLYRPGSPSPSVKT